MSESLMLTTLASLLGLSAGVSLLGLLDKVLSANPANNPALLNPSVDIQTVVVAAVVLLISGFMAGLILVWRAMQIKAIDAIRDE